MFRKVKIVFYSLMTAVSVAYSWGFFYLAAEQFGGYRRVSNLFWRQIIVTKTVSSDSNLFGFFCLIVLMLCGVATFTALLVMAIREDKNQANELLPR